MRHAKDQMENLNKKENIKKKERVRESSTDSEIYM